MALGNFLVRAFSTREHKPKESTGAPTRSLSVAAILGFKKDLKPSRIDALKEALCTPVSDTNFKNVLSSLPSGLRRRRNSPSSDLCSGHASLLSGPLVEIANMLTYELHRRLAHLYQFPRIHLSLETQTYLYQTLRQYRIYFREELYYDMHRKGDLESTLGATCLACTLSLFFRDEAAVKALAVCAKSRRQRGCEWPRLLDWLERKEENWEEQWKSDGANVRRDRKRAQVWRKCCRVNEEEELDEEPGNENDQFLAWVQEQKERAIRFSPERNCPDEEKMYGEIDQFGPSNILHHDQEQEMEHEMEHEMEQEEKEEKEKRDLDPEALAYARAQAYETLTGEKASSHVMAQISEEDQYEPPEWRRRRAKPAT